MPFQSKLELLQSTRPTPDLFSVWPDRGRIARRQAGRWLQRMRGDAKGGIRNSLLPIIVTGNRPSSVCVRE
ncbi:hypothetical protein [Phyllobacterium lublinensis]|uniref:hypothetical protein n=1 Tax=Phyllobacterium lublinensis TaxID=2875708 RepID=UPI001CCB3BC0|nr:hypothetical protein [Phyllobacterium sp. 2063]MBZ9655309.1 hypothetical protein [Phyllobacterium sp. 2063]